MVDPIYKTIGALIRQRRKALKHKQEVLAGKLGMSRGALANIETGRQSILVHQLYRFATALGLEPKDLMPPSQTPRSVDTSDAMLPADLKPQQKQQVALFVEDAVQDLTSKERDTHGRKRK